MHEYYKNKTGHLKKEMDRYFLLIKPELEKFLIRSIPK